MHVEHHITINASAHSIYRLYENVTSWHTWDPDTKSASLDGPFEVGSKGKLTPTKGNTVPIVITKAEPARCFTVESKIPLFRMRFEHELTEEAGVTKVVHRVTFSGPLRLIIGSILLKQLNSGLPATLMSLKAHAETPSEA